MKLRLRMLKKLFRKSAKERKPLTFHSLSLAGHCFQQEIDTAKQLSSSTSSSETTYSLPEMTMTEQKVCHSQNRHESIDHSQQMPMVNCDRIMKDSFSSAASIRDKWQRSMSLSTLSLYSFDPESYEREFNNGAEYDDEEYGGVNAVDEETYKLISNSGSELAHNKSFTGSSSSSDLGYCSTPTSDAFSGQEASDEFEKLLTSQRRDSAKEDEFRRRTRPLLVTAI